ncbi:hypothetical protein CLI75_10230 [Porphyromonas gingivalis]|nr:hypothetical protein CLI75_10230 [Porphyromonas gingivalis]PDP78946.1 hypothetical protein CLI73_06480 [Porphyromonas gingivalis]
MFFHWLSPLKTGHIKLVHEHRIIWKWGQKGKSSIGRSYGFKLHIVINDRGKIISKPP